MAPRGRVIRLATETFQSSPCDWGCMVKSASSWQGLSDADFPGRTERLLLSVAANQAAIGLQEARLLSEQKRIADELDQRVAQRTRNLQQPTKS